MKDLIEALSILSKYGTDGEFPTHCEHDVLLTAGMDIKEGEVSAEDAKRLDALGFHWSTEYDCWASFRFGSC
jgi:hypothetical protein